MKIAVIKIGDACESVFVRRDRSQLHDSLRMQQKVSCRQRQIYILSRDIEAYLTDEQHVPRDKYRITTAVTTLDEVIVILDDEYGHFATLLSLKFAISA